MATVKKPRAKKVETTDEVVESKSFKCANCEDSGSECYKCGAGKEVVDIV